MFTVLVFGNPYLKEDTLALRIANSLHLEGVRFKISENVNDLLAEDYQAIMDVAYGVPRVVLLEDLDKLREHRLLSLHDYDVTFFLKLMKAMGRLGQVKIIAIPVHEDQERASRDVAAILQELMLSKTGKSLDNPS